MSTIANPKSNIKFLPQLDDVTVNTPTDKQPLAYNGSSGQWENSDKLTVSEMTASKFNGNGSQITNLTASNVTNFTADVRYQVTANGILTYNAGTASLPHITASHWYNGASRWAGDVRAQFTAGNGIGYNPNTGVISSTAISSVLTKGNVSGSGVINDEIGLKENVKILGTFEANNGIFKDLTVSGTASIGMLNTVNQQSLYVGDKYITILSGANTHVLVDGAGILFGSGSTDATTGDQSSVAYMLYRKGNAPTDFTSDYVEIFPGARINGSLTASGPSSFTQITASNINSTGPSYFTQITASGGFSGDGTNLTNLQYTSISNFITNVRSSITAIGNLQYSNGTASLKDEINLSSVTASFKGNGSQLTNTTASNWSNGASRWSSDVRNQLSAGTGISYDKNTGVISATGGGGGSDISTGTTTGLTASNELFILCSGSVTGSVITVQLPLVSVIGNGKNYVIKNSGVGIVTVRASGSDKIDGAASSSLYTTYSSYSVFGSASNWWIF